MRQLAREGLTAAGGNNTKSATIMTTAEALSLAELNDVLAVNRRHGKRVLTIDLQFAKKTRKRTRRTRERVQGV